MEIVDSCECPVMCYGLKNDFRNELFEGFLLSAGLCRQDRGNQDDLLVRKKGKYGGTHRGRQVRAHGRADRDRRKRNVCLSVPETLQRRKDQRRQVKREGIRRGCPDRSRVF